MTERIRRPGVRLGYDLWASSYDQTDNPLVFLDRKYAQRWLGASEGERILDLGCGTGVHLEAMRRHHARPVGLDFSIGMLRKAAERAAGVPLIVSDMHGPLPFRNSSFDTVLCALVSEHLKDLSDVWTEVYRVVRPDGRFLVTAFHPDLAHGGTEANFQVNGTEMRLGAELHTVEDYRASMKLAGFSVLRWEEVRCDASVVEVIPRASRYLGRKMLLLIDSAKTGQERVRDER